MFSEIVPLIRTTDTTNAAINMTVTGQIGGSLTINFTTADYTFNDELTLDISYIEGDGSRIVIDADTIDLEDDSLFDLAISHIEGDSRVVIDLSVNIDLIDDHSLFQLNISRIDSSSPHTIHISGDQLTPNLYHLQN